MVAVQQHVQAWKFLHQSVDKVSDPILRNAMMAEFRRHALAEWGYCPGDGTISTNTEVQLDAWEKEFVQDITDSNSYGIDTRAEKRAATMRESKAWMRHFIEQNGKLLDIPDNIRTPAIEALYYECLYEYGDDLMAHMDYLTKQDMPQAIGEILPVVMDEAHRRMHEGQGGTPLCSL